MNSSGSLPFRVAPHMLEDFGLNLYSDLPRALIEFVANAHDADADWAKITMDFSAIKRERDIVRAHYDSEREKFSESADDDPPAPLASRTLPDAVTIEIADNGFGMSEDDLETKFLIAGRKRREEDGDNGAARTPAGRLLMGRKGLGKLAGFGIARRIEVISRKKGESHATKITLDFDEIRKYRSLSEVRVPKQIFEDGCEIDEHGTRIILSRLLHEPSKSKRSTIETHIGEHFELIQPDEFAAHLSGSVIPTPARTYVYAYPDNDSVKIEQLVAHRVDTPEGVLPIKYRIRFRGKDDALPASQRGVRVYAHRRLAAAPSLLDADPNVHGFRQADYLEGVVEADFIDDQPLDYIATDRQSLRWETPLLAPLREFLSEQMAKACREYQNTRDKKVPDKVKADQWIVKLVKRQGFGKKDEQLAYQIATTLARATDEAVTSEEFRERLEPIVEGLGHGAIISAIMELAKESHPDLQRAAVEITRLTKDQLDSSIAFVRARVKGIEALEKIVNDQDFKDKENEKDIQKLFKDSPWLVDPTFSYVMTSDVAFVDVLNRLAKELQIDQYAPAGAEADKKRPDLVFLIGNTSLGRVVIVELKSSNTALEADHLEQLFYYMEIAENWLGDHGHSDIRVHGQLIGSMAPARSMAQGVVALRRQIKKSGPSDSWIVRDYLEVLRNTRAAHNEMLQVYEASHEHEGSQEEAAASSR